jgi:predicted permease
VAQDLNPPRAMLSTLIQNTTFGVRLMIRDRARSTLAMVTLALGIAATTTIFALVDAALLRPLPFAASEQLVVIWNRGEPGGRADLWLAPAEYHDIAATPGSLASVGALQDLAFNYTGEGPPARLSALAVSASLLPTLGVQPTRGRRFTADDDRRGAPLAAILSHHLWQTRFGGSREILGTPIALDGRRYEIVGVLPADFMLPKLSSVLPDRPDLLVALEPHTPDALRTNRTVNMIHVIGRRQPGASIDAVQHELDTIVRSIAPQHATAYTRRAWALSVFDLQTYVRAPIRPALLVMLACVALMLVLACANAAALLLTRAEQRRTELAVRVALGATGRRLAAQLLSESVVLAAVAGALGAVLAAWMIDFVAASSVDPRLVRGLQLDGRVLAFASAATLLCGLAAGVLPIVAGRARNLQVPMQDGGRAASGRSSRASVTLVAAEVAVAFSLLVACALLVQTFARLTRVDPGFSPDGVLSATVSLPPSYQPADASTLFARIAGELAQQPGVAAAGAVSQLPFSGQVFGSAVVPQTGRRAGEEISADMRGATPGYFDALGIPLLEGRTFNAGDRASGRGVAIIDRSLADRLWPGQLAVGQRLLWIRGRVELDVIGVVGSIRHDGPRDVTEETVYRPVEQYPRWAMSLVIRTDGDPAGLASTMSSVVRQHDASLPVTQVMPLRDLVARALDQPRFSAGVAALSALAALGLAVIGVYGVVSQGVSRRSREIAIRLAIGAAPRQVIGLVIRQGAVALAIGLAAGTLVAWTLGNALSSLLFGVAPTDPATVAAALAVIVGAGLLACWIPARRSVRGSLLTTLRAD